MMSAESYRSDDPNGAGPEDGYTSLLLARSPDGDLWLATNTEPGERSMTCPECGQYVGPSVFRVRLSGSDDPRNREVIKALASLQIALAGGTVPNPWEEKMPVGASGKSRRKP